MKGHFKRKGSTIVELISRRCTQCNGTVVPIGDGTMGRCEYCGSLFSLSDKPTVQASAVSNDEAGTDEELDLETFFDDFSDSLDADEDYEFFVGEDFDTSKGESKLDGARKNFGVSRKEDVYLVLDTTIFGSCKVGFACAESGIYMKDEDGKQRYISWEDFPEVEIEVDGSTLTIDGSPFFTQDEEADLLFDMLCDLKDEL